MGVTIGFSMLDYPCLNTPRGLGALWEISWSTSPVDMIIDGAEFWGSGCNFTRKESAETGASWGSPLDSA